MALAFVVFFFVVELVGGLFDVVDADIGAILACGLASGRGALARALAIAVAVEVRVTDIAPRAVARQVGAGVGAVAWAEGARAVATAKVAVGLAGGAARVEWIDSHGCFSSRRCRRVTPEKRRRFGCRRMPTTRAAY